MKPLERLSCICLLAVAPSGRGSGHRTLASHSGARAEAPATWQVKRSSEISSCVRSWDTLFWIVQVAKVCRMGASSLLCGPPAPGGDVPSPGCTRGRSRSCLRGRKKCLGVNLRASGDGFGGLFAKRKWHVYRYKENICFT